jgi:hypothetical protein
VTKRTNKYGDLLLAGEYRVPHFHLHTTRYPPPRILFDPISRDLPHLGATIGARKLDMKPTDRRSRHLEPWPP